MPTASKIRTRSAGPSAQDISARDASPALSRASSLTEGSPAPETPTLESNKHPRYASYCALSCPHLRISLAVGMKNPRVTEILLSGRRKSALLYHNPEFTLTPITFRRVQIADDAVETGLQPAIRLTSSVAILTPMWTSLICCFCVCSDAGIAAPLTGPGATDAEKSDNAEKRPQPPVACVPVRLCRAIGVILRGISLG